jgi:putative ATP-dependent endonuclease of OLD family
MYISELKLWNFRKYGKSYWDLDKPHLLVPFNQGLNVLIGENDSGKTAIIDAIKLVLKTHSYEWIKVEDIDFFNDSTKLRIEIVFRGLKFEEAKNFTEWIGWDGDGDQAKPLLRLIYEVERKNDKILPSDIKAGMDDIGYPLNAEAREYLKSTYLKALRDADVELVAKKNSRVSQILQGHDLFKKKDGVPHEFEGWFAEVNEKIKYWFENDVAPTGVKSNREQIKDIIDNFLQEFIKDSFSSKLQLTNPEIKAILEKISLGIEGVINLGLGTMNRLYMATELLHLKKEWDGLKLCLIEELEAHLHPQAQMKVVEALLKEKEVQFILTTHSPNLASKVDIDKLFICNGEEVYPLRKEIDTKLEKENYLYLKRFLDVTKSNLFFAKGVIIVEGWAEEILIPAIAERLGYDLTKNEVSIVNVGSTAYLNFAKIFLRNDDKRMNIPVSIITDLDIRPDENGIFDEIKESEKRTKIEKDFSVFNDTDVKLRIAKQWTLEWCLFMSSSLSDDFKESVLKVHSKTDDFKKDEYEVFKPEFQKKLIHKLKKIDGTSPLDKVAVANTLSERIIEKQIVINPSDEYINYLVEAIKHACRM